MAEKWQDPSLPAWERFVVNRQLDPDVARPIGQSWKRCWPRLDPHRRISLSRIDGQRLLSVQAANLDMISIARPIMEDICQFIEGSNSVLVLSTRAGYILDLLGDKCMTDVLMQAGISHGTLLAEEHIGTNAFALAIIERLPIEVVGAEHFSGRYHGLADAAAPIFDISGKPLGAMGIFTAAQRAHPHSLGLAVSGASAIEVQYQADLLLEENNAKLSELNAILGSIPEGILAWGLDGVLMHVNSAAIEILGLDDSQLLGRPLNDVLKIPPFVQDAIENHKVLNDVEATLLVNETPVNCVLSLRLVWESKGPRANLAVLRRARDVRRLVQGQIAVQVTRTMDDLVGTSVEIRRARRLARSASQAKAPVLIWGERGTGKGTLARAIHSHGHRHDGGFILFACSSIPHDALLPELVGYAECLKGGRLGGHPSKFELAVGGTIYLQDVDALSLETQAILLDALELGVVQRMGGKRAIAVDVHVITSTTANLKARVGEGSFRADLYYRLSPFEIWLPPLRQRIDDLPDLVDKILSRLSCQRARPLGMTPETLSIMRSYDWPGNIRELEGVLERAAIQASSSNMIAPMHLPSHIRQLELGPTGPGTLKGLPSLDDVERQTIMRAAHLCNGNRTRMAKVLGISRTTVWRRLKDLDISFKEPSDQT
jgi:transcriptional regulator of acetoin/glycerol metabolism